MSTSKKSSSLVDDGQAAAAADQEASQAEIATIRNSSAFVFVSRNVVGSSSSSSNGQVENIRPRPLPGLCEDDQRSFIQEFREQIVDLIREFRRDFPYRQTIDWTMEYGRNKNHTVHIIVKQPRSMRREDHH